MTEEMRPGEAPAEQEKGRIPRPEALDLLHRLVKQPAILKHSLASEAVLAALADHLGADRQTWALAGLLHDLDIDLTHCDPAVHGREGARILQELGIEEEVVTAIRRHNERSCDEKRTTVLDHALAAGETITGLIVATALIQPDRKLASVQARSVLKHMKDASFAAGVNRSSILECEALDMDLSAFAALALAAMQAISPDLGL
jgi:uncharacterized protein